MNLKLNDTWPGLFLSRAVSGYKETSLSYNHIPASSLSRLGSPRLAASGAFLCLIPLCLGVLVASHCDRIFDKASLGEEEISWAHSPS